MSEAQKEIKRKGDRIYQKRRAEMKRKERLKNEKTFTDHRCGFLMKLNEEQKISLEDLYSHLNQEKEYLRHQKENNKWFYILTGVMVLIFYLDGFNKDKYEAVVSIISVCWFIALLFMYENFWDHENLKNTRQAIVSRQKVLAKYETYAFLNRDTNGLTVTQKDDNTLYDFQKLLDKDEPSPEQTQRFLDELGRKIKEDDKVDDPTNVVKFNKVDKKTGYIIYIQEIQTSEKLHKVEIKICLLYTSDAADE